MTRFINVLHRFIFELIQLIPDCIQAATAVGIGLITALAGAIEIHLVVKGEHTILDMGDLTSEVIIAMVAVVTIAVALYYHVKGAFCIGLFTGTALFWIFVGAYSRQLLYQLLAFYRVLCRRSPYGICRVSGRRRRHGQGSCSHEPRGTSAHVRLAFPVHPRSERSREIHE